MGIIMRAITAIICLSLLSACGGGGGGPGNPNIRPSPNPENPSPSPSPSLPDVDFADPVSAGSYQLFTSGSDTNPIQDFFVQDLNNDNKEEVVIAGRMSASASQLGACNGDLDCKKAAYENSQISIYGFNSSDVFVNQTSSWFSGTDNQIIGTEPSLKFGDFDGDNTVDMAIGHSTDFEHFGPLTIFKNTGSSSFNREDHDIGDKWMHDIAVGDINQDGVDDILVSGYSNITVMLGGSSGFTQLDTTQPGSSGVAVGDFLGDGTVTMIFVDSGFGERDFTAHGDVDDDTVLASFSQTGAGTGEFTTLAQLPSSRFESSDYDDLFDPTQNERGHDIRALPFDFNNDGLLDVIVISVSSAPLDNQNRTEVQFLQNGGGGSFTDVTDDVRVGWDVFVNGDYNPQLVDVNDDGLIDILLSSDNFDNDGEDHNATRVLVQTTEGKYVQSYTEIFNTFQSTVTALHANTGGGEMTIRFLTGPDGDKYLVTSVFLNNGSNVLYTSKLGNAGGSTAQASIDLIQQVWPYVTDEVAAQILAGTAFTDFEGFDPELFGAGVIDLEKAMMPIGQLRLPLEGRSGTVPITGLLSGVNFGELGRVQAVDSMGRGFEIGINSMHTPVQQDAWYDVNFTDQSYTRMDYNVGYVIQDGMFNYSPTNDTGDYTMGLRHIKLAKDWYVQGQYTVLNGRNPWFHMDGMWGKIQSSNTFETVITHLHDDLTFNFGTMYTNTEYDKGLITNVTPLTSVYSEVSWRRNGFRAAIGTMPYLVDGGITLRLPTSIDFTGNVHYTEFDYEIRNNFAEYISLGYTKQLDFNSSFGISAYTNGYGFNKTQFNYTRNF